MKDYEREEERKNVGKAKRLQCLPLVPDVSERSREGTNDVS